MNQPVQDPVEGVVPGDCGQWRARLDLDLQRRREGTRLVGAAHEGPLYVQKPFYPEGPDCAHLYLLHPPGGIVSGDSLEVSVDLGRDATALLTTPGAARAYRAREGGARQYQRTRLTLAERACIEWFPLETIVYDGARVEVETDVALAAGARCMLWELTCLGLPASGEPFRQGSFRQRYRVYREGVPVFVDGITLHDHNRARMAGAGGLAGRPVSGFFLAGPFEGTDEQDLARLREAMRGAAPGTLSVTALGDFYLGRYLGASAEHARAGFANWWRILRPRLLGREACAPRIWLT